MRAQHRRGLGRAGNLLKMAGRPAGLNAASCMGALSLDRILREKRRN